MSTNMTLRNTDASVRVFGRVGNVRKNDNAGGKKVVNISVAFQRSWKKQDSNDFEHKTQWVEFACWEVGADRAANIETGDIVSCEFSMADLQADVYEKNGQHAAALKCPRATLLLVAKKGSSLPAEVPADVPVEEAI